MKWLGLIHWQKKGDTGAWRIHTDSVCAPLFPIYALTCACMQEMWWASRPHGTDSRTCLCDASYVIFGMCLEAKQERDDIVFCKLQGMEEKGTMGCLDFPFIANSSGMGRIEYVQGAWEEALLLSLSQLAGGPDPGHLLTVCWERNDTWHSGRTSQLIWPNTMKRVGEMNGEIEGICGSFYLKKNSNLPVTIWKKAVMANSKIQVGPLYPQILHPWIWLCAKARPRLEAFTSPPGHSWMRLLVTPGRLSEASCAGRQHMASPGPRTSPWGVGKHFQFSQKMALPTRPNAYGCILM